MNASRFYRYERLHLRRDFEQVIRGGRRVHGQFIWVAVRRNQAGVTRWAVVASRALGNAVVRNRVKRRVREVLRRTKHAAVQTVDVVVFPRAGVAAAPFDVLTQDFVEVMERCGVYPGVS